MPELIRSIRSQGHPRTPQLNRDRLSGCWSHCSPHRSVESIAAKFDQTIRPRFDHWRFESVTRGT